MNQQKNLESVIKWFYFIENKSQCKFIQLDIAELHPSVLEEILDNASLFTQQYINIPEKDLHIINIVGNPHYTMKMKLGRKK